MSRLTYVWKGKTLHIDKLLGQAILNLCWNMSKDKTTGMANQDYLLVVTGDRLVRIGKSRTAKKLGSFFAYCLANLKLNMDAFNEDNIFWSGKEMQEQAFKLPMFSVLIYDEARESLGASKRTQAQQELLDFFNSAGQFGHIYILCIWDFFGLKAEIAVGRAECLINMYRAYEKVKVCNRDQWIKDLGMTEVTNFIKGRFMFFNREGKNFLYDHFMKTTDRSFRIIDPTFPVGVMEDEDVIDEVIYAQKKNAAMERLNPKNIEIEKIKAKEKEREERKVEKDIKEKPLTPMKERANKQRDIAISLLTKNFGMSDIEIAKALGTTTDIVHAAIHKVKAEI